MVFNKKLLCFTLSGRKIFYFEIYKKKAGDKKAPQLKGQKIIFLTARVHPSESNSSWVLRGLIDELAKADSQSSSYLRENYTFVIIPILNPDGVCLGNTRTSISGYDLN